MPSQFVRKTFVLLLKLSASGLLLYALYRQLFVRSTPETLDLFKKGFGASSIPYFLSVLLLMLINWGLETQKWRLLLAKVEELSFTRAFKAILGGVALSVFTPNRVGEYGGRVLLLQKADKLVAVALTLVGSFAQLIVNGLFGLLGTWAYASLFMPDFAQGIPYFPLIFMGGLALVLATLLYFNLQWLPRFAKTFPRLNLLNKYLHAATDYPQKELLKVLILSTLRYCVYAIQYILLLYAFGCGLSLLNAWVAVSAIFFAQTLLPTIAILEAGIRGNLSIYFIGQLCDNLTGILTATLMLWCVNLALPALWGMFIILVYNKKGKA